MPVALSILQPWAWLIVNGFKDVENRTWQTARRGPVLIHAGKGFDAEGHAWVNAHFAELGLNAPIPAPDSYSRGGVVGQARLCYCVRAFDSPWFNGPVGFVFSEAKPLPFRPLRGQLGFFKVPPA